MDAMYANKFTVSLSETEAVFRFCWVLPHYDEQDKVTGIDIAEEKLITLPREGYQKLLSLMQELEKNNPPSK